MNNVAGIGAELAVASEAPGVIAVGRHFSTAAAQGAGVLELPWLRGDCGTASSQVERSFFVYMISFWGQIKFT